MSQQDRSKSTDFADYVAEVERTASPEELADLRAASRRFALGAQLLRKRLSLGYTQGELADISGVPQSEISRVENGRANPTVDTLGSLGDAMGITLQYEESPAQKG